LSCVNSEGKQLLHSNFRKRYKKHHSKWYWQQNKDKYEQPQLTQLGTTDFKPNMCQHKDGTPDFKKEKTEINKEKQRIKQQYQKPPWANYWINDQTREIEDYQILQHKHAILDFIPKIMEN